MKQYEKIEEESVEEHEYTTSFNLNSYGIDFDVCGLVRRLNAESIYLPDFQRNYVWEPSKASKFIESLLLGLPIPSVCLYKEEDNKQIIIDGFQRLETIRSFYRKTFPNGKKFILHGVHSVFEGKSIDELDDESRLKLDDTLIHATVVKAEDPQDENYNAVYQIFERLNTGGVNLTAQEIRDCIYHGPFQKVITLLASNTDFKNTFRISDKRKKDKEIILRLFSLSLSYNDYSGNMKEFLNTFMNKYKIFSKDKLISEITIFEKTMKIVSNLDINLFKPNKKLSLAILDAVFVGTFKYISKNNISDIKKYQNKISSLIDTPNFQKNIETGKTHHTSPLKERIEIAISEIGKI